MTISRNIMSMAATAATIALASAAAFAVSPPEGSSGKAVGAGDTVHCYGVNSCKGSADCKTAGHECKGQNGCKGKGFKMTTAKKCLSRGGVIGDIA